MNNSRRAFLKAGLVSTVSVASRTLLGDESRDKDSRRDKLARRLKGQIGITTSSVGSQLAGRAIGIKFSLLELPRIMRDELDMRVIDLNTSSLASTKGAYLDQVRAAADKAGCILTNLKLNQRGLDMNSRDRNVRQKAIATYKKSIDVAQRLGLHWARPLPLKKKPDWDLQLQFLNPIR